MYLIPDRHPNTRDRCSNNDANSCFNTCRSSAESGNDVDEDGNTLSISITGKLFDSVAENVLTEGSASNPTPEPGQYIIMLKIVETYIGGDEPAVNVAPYHFEIYVDGIGYPAVSAVFPDGYTTFPTDSILKNATEGMACLYRSQGNAKLAYEYQEEPLGFIRINY